MCTRQFLDCLNLIPRVFVPPLVKGNEIQIASSKFTFCPFRLPRPFLLSLPFAFHILPGCCEKLVVDNGQSLVTGPRSIIGIKSHFATIFAPNR